MSTVTDYIGRTVDLQALQGAKQFGDTLLQQTLVGETNRGLIIAGVQKLAQRVTIEFFTDVGSITYEPTRGTAFMPSLRQGRLRTALEVEQAFRSAVIDIKRTLRQQELDTDPDDERIDEIELISIVLSGDTVILRFRVISLAGDERAVLFPLMTTLEGIS